MPVYEAMYNNTNHIENESFALCLGKNGGRFTLGGYDETLSIGPMQWFNVSSTGHFNLMLDGIYIGSTYIEDSESYKFGFLDSGTTFSQIPAPLNIQFKDIITAHCLHKGCIGERVYPKSE